MKLVTHIPNKDKQVRSTYVILGGAANSEFRPVLRITPRTTSNIYSILLPSPPPVSLVQIPLKTLTTIDFILENHCFTPTIPFPVKIVEIIEIEVTT